MSIGKETQGQLELGGLMKTMWGEEKAMPVIAVRRTQAQDYALKIIEEGRFEGKFSQLGNIKNTDRIEGLFQY